MATKASARGKYVAKTLGQATLGADSDYCLKLAAYYDTSKTEVAAGPAWTSWHDLFETDAKAGARFEKCYGNAKKGVLGK